MATIFFFSLFRTDPVTDMKIPSDTENQLLSTTAPAFESNIHAKGVAGHSPRYSLVKNLFEVEVSNITYLIQSRPTRNTGRSIEKISRNQRDPWFIQPAPLIFVET